MDNPIEGSCEEQPPQRTPRTRPRSALSQRHSSMMSLSNMSQAPRWSMLGKPRAASTDRRPLQPDPGSYNSPDPCQTSKMSRSANATFGVCTSSRKVITPDPESDIPGPGSYGHETREDVGKQPRQMSACISTPRARERPVRETTPDPGYYMPITPQCTSKMGRSPSYGFANSRASRFPMLKERAPGPGAYNSVRDLQGSQSGVNFLNSPRQSTRASATTPDPGSYSPNDPCATSRMIRSPRANFTSRTRTGRVPDESTEKKERKEITPGPGSYAHKELLGETAGIQFPRSPERFRPKPRIETPDPGFYHAVDPSATSKMAKQAGYAFGDLTTGRCFEKAVNGGKVVDEAGDENGTTANNSTINGVRSPRGLNTKEDAPGPGSYEVIYPGTAVAPTAPRWGFGNDQARPSLGPPTRAATMGITPGPGTYYSTTSVGEGPKFTIRVRKGDRYTTTPGPGQYGGHYTQFI